MLKGIEPLNNIDEACRWFITQEELHGRTCINIPERIPGLYGTVSYKVITMNESSLERYIHYIFLKSEPIHAYAALAHDPGAGEGHGIDSVQIPYIEQEILGTSYIAFMEKYTRKCNIIRTEEFLKYVRKYNIKFPNKRDSIKTGREIITWAVPTSILKPIVWQIKNNLHSHAGKFKNLDDYS